MSTSKDPARKPRVASKSPEQGTERQITVRSPTPSIPAKSPQIIQYWGLPIFLTTDPGPTVQTIKVDEEMYQIFPGESHLFMTSKKSNFFAMGNNDFGQLGLNHTDPVQSPIFFELKTKQQIKEISTGSDFVFAITVKQEVFGWGGNLKGQLGLGHMDNVLSPTRIRSLTPTVVGTSIGAGDVVTQSLLGSNEFLNKIVCGALHTLALTNNGRVFACGFGETYALGNNSPKTTPNFEEVAFFKDQSLRPVRIAAGTSHSGCLVGNQVYLWGTWGSSRAMQYKKPTLVEVETDALNICLGDMLTVILTSKGDVFTLGDNIDGQLGSSAANHPTPKKVTLPYKTEYIDCGLNHVIALSKYKIFAWGCNKRGQIHPKNLLPYFNTPMELEWITNSLPLAIHCGPQQTYLISKEPVLLPERPVTEVDNSVLFRKEIETYKSKMLILKKENEKLKDEIKNILNNLNSMDKEGAEAPTRKSTDPNEDIMNKFKSELKLSRTLRPVFEIDLKEIKIMTKISEGAFGIIYKAKWREITVAIKTLKQEYMKDDTIKDFLSELTRRVLHHGVPATPQHSDVPRRLHQVAGQPGDRAGVLQEQLPLGPPPEPQHPTSVGEAGLDRDRHSQGHAVPARVQHPRAPPGLEESQHPVGRQPDPQNSRFRVDPDSG